MHYVYPSKDIEAYIHSAFRELQRCIGPSGHAPGSYCWKWRAIATLNTTLQTVRGPQACVYGSIEPTVESALLALSDRVHVTTIDFNRLTFSHERLTTVTVEEWERKGNGDRCDVSISLSSFDHTGLGRFGDPLDPDGDLKSMDKARHDLRINGVLLITVPLGKDIVVWNALRRYGRARLPLLLTGFELIDDPINAWAHRDLGVLDADPNFKRSQEPPLLLRAGCADTPPLFLREKGAPTPQGEL